MKHQEPTTTTYRKETVTVYCLHNTKLIYDAEVIRLLAAT